ncbi:MAG: ribonuclease HII [Patescibacteria group bacterium]|nr:ribonuclease HII [Patescibacteria group bacterium]
MVIEPTLEEEQRLWSEGLSLIGGIDEAGRGSWAGPVVAAVVVLPKTVKKAKFVRDSKLLSPKKRGELYGTIIEQCSDFGVGIIGHKVIDKVGINEATKMAANDAINMLKTSPEYLLIDAIDLSKHCSINQKSIIKGDQKIYSISCASIIAKVTRDNLMSNLCEEYKKYEFYSHKGYGTKRHQELLAEYGPCNIHRFSYAPIRKYL